MSLLDIHVDGRVRSAPYEILEAGTGHGSLALHLARAIHAANCVSSNTHEIASKQAVVHSVDVNSHHSQHAQDVINGFRRGMYGGDIEFHVGRVCDWLENQTIERGLSSSHRKDFLSHVLLDMPDAQEVVALAARALHTDGCLVVFNPSITQIMAIVNAIDRDNLLLKVDQILESSPLMTGGKLWDVRAVTPRARLRTTTNASAVESPAGRQASGDMSTETDISGKDQNSVTGPESMVCRPKAGLRVQGGGFIGVWKKMKSRD